MLNDEESKAARAELVPGATFTIPTNKALREVAGLPLIDSVEESTSNGELAKFTISYTARPNVTEAITDNILASNEE